MEGQAEDQGVGGVLVDGVGDEPQAEFVVAGLVDGQGAGDAGDIAADGQAGASITEIDGEVAQGGWVRESKVVSRRS